MESQAFELIVITPEKDYPGETGWVNRLFSEGLAILHLRKPGWTTERLLQYLEQVGEEFHERIMLHGDPAIGEKFRLKGMHYPVRELPACKPEHFVSCSTHSWQELQAVANRVDYAFISPFYDSISKEGYRANKDLKAIPEEVKGSKVVALGGIDAGNIREVQALELRGAAVLGAVWQAGDPLEAYRQLKEHLSMI